MKETILTLALQKSGRLTEDCRMTLEKAGLIIPDYGRALRVQARNFPLEVLFLRASDIAEVVASGAADLGVFGRNDLMESLHYIELEEVRSMRFGSCRLSIAVPEASGITTTAQLDGKIIATSHPMLLQKYLNKHKLNAQSLVMEGSVEIAPSLKIADAICDLVSSGSTLQANSLRELEVIFKSDAILIAQKEFAPDKQHLLEEFLLRIDSVTNALTLKSVMMNAPRSALSAIEDILPGIDSPTVTPLAREDWVAIHSVVEEDDDFWNKIRQLKAAGASGILIKPVDRVIF